MRHTADTYLLLFWNTTAVKICWEDVSANF